MKIFYISVLTIFVISCSNPKALQKSFNKIKVPIDYLHDGKISNCEKTDSVNLILNRIKIESLTTLKKVDGSVLPLLFFNFSYSDFLVLLGQKSISQDYTDFFINSLIDESKRSGCFVLNNETFSNSPYTLEITVDSCITQSHYKKTSSFIFLLLAFSSTSTEEGLPALAILKVTAQLKKGSVIVNEKKYSVSHIKPYFKSISKDVDELRRDFVANMVESLSLGTKDCIEQIISDVNSSLNK